MALVRYGIVTAVLLFVGLLGLLLARENFEVVKLLAPMTKLRSFRMEGVWNYDQNLALRRIPNSSYNVLVADHIIEHPILGKGFTPPRNVGHSDQDGFRRGSSTGDADIVILGDSFMESGDTDQDTFSEHLAHFTGKSIANLGTSFWGPPQSLIALKQYGLSRKPRLILFAFFEGNDIPDIAAFDSFREHGTYHDFPNPRAPLTTRYWRFLQDIWEFLGEFVFQNIRQPIARLRGRAIDTDMQIAVYFNTGTRKFWDTLSWYSDTRSPDVMLVSPEWKELRRILSDFQETATTHQAKFAVLFIPIKANIYGKYSTDRSGNAWKSRKEEILSSKHHTEQALAKILSELNIPLVSLTKLFEQHATDPELLYYRFDGHWASYGRKVASQYVADELSRMYPELFIEKGNVSAPSPPARE